MKARAHALLGAIALSAASVGGAAPALAARCGGDFGSFVSSMSAEAQAAGISANVVSAALGGVQQDPAVLSFDRRQQLALEQFGAAAIMRHGCERADHRHLADIALAEIRLQPPDRDHDFRRHAKALLDARQQRAVPL